MSRSIKKPLLIWFISGLTLILAIAIVSYAGNTYSSYRDNYWLRPIVFIFLVLMLVIVLLEIIISKYIPIGISPFRLIFCPSVMFLLFILVIIIMGSLSFYFIKLYFPLVSSADISIGVKYYMLVIAVSFFGYIFCSSLNKGSRKIRYLTSYQWRWHSLRNFIFLIFVLVLLGHILIVKKIGFIPALRKGTGLYFLRYQGSELGFLDKFIKLAPFVVMMSGNYLIVKKHDLVMKLVFIVSAFMTFFTSARMYFVLPILVLFMIYTRKNERLSISRVSILGVILVFTIIIGYRVWLSRMNEPDESMLPGYLSIFQSSPNVEFADFCRLIERTNIYGFSDNGVSVIFKSITAPMLPRQIWKLLGIDKDSRMIEHAYTIWDIIEGETNRLRVGSYGEVYLFSGFSGLIIMCIIVGALLRLCDTSFLKSSTSSCISIFIAFISTMLMFLPCIQLYLFFDYFVLYTFLFALAFIFCGKKVL